MKMHAAVWTSLFVCICLCSIASAQSNPTLPQAWANNHECDPPGGVYDVTRTMGTDYTSNAAGLNKAISDWAGAADQWWHILVPHGSTLQVTSQVTLLGKVGATKCLVFDSDTPLTSNQTVCSHKTIDTLTAPARATWVARMMCARWEPWRPIGDPEITECYCRLVHSEGQGVPSGQTITLSRTSRCDFCADQTRPNHFL